MQLIKGIPVSPGVVIGRIFALDDERQRIARRAIPASAAPAEQKRLDDAHLPTVTLLDNTEAVSVVTKAYADAFGVNKSRAEASRLIKQGSVQIDGENVQDPKAQLSLKAGQILRLDKTHAVRIG